MFEQSTECIQFWAVLQLDINGFIKSKKSEKRETSIEPPADLAADLATDLAADLADLTNLADLVNLAYSSNKKRLLHFIVLLAGRASNALGQ